MGVIRCFEKTYLLNGGSDEGLSLNPIAGQFACNDATFAVLEYTLGMFYGGASTMIPESDLDKVGYKKVGFLQPRKGGLYDRVELVS